MCVRRNLRTHAQTGLSSPAVGVWWAVGCMVGGRGVETGSTAPPNTGGLNGRGGWYWVPSRHHPHTTAPNPPEPPTSVRLPPRLPTHSPPDCRRGNNLQPNQHNVSSNNDFRQRLAQRSSSTAQEGEYFVRLNVFLHPRSLLTRVS